MKKVFVASSLMAALVLYGCQMEKLDNNQEESKVFTAIIDTEFDCGTKTSLDEAGNVLWKKGDQVSVFGGSTINEQYQVNDSSDGKTAASLNKVSGGGFVAGTEIDNNVAFYPYTPTAEIAKSGSSYIIREIILPGTQNYAPGSFGNGAFPMAAVTSSADDMNLKFKNILGGLKLQLKGAATIRSITVSGNNNELLYGSAEVTVTAGSVPSLSLTDASAKSVTLDCGTGVALNTETATPFVIALPPITMTGGFTVVVTDTEGEQMEISTSRSQTITRSSLLTMPEVDYVGSVTEYEYIISTSAGGTKASWSGTDMVWSTGDKVLLTDGASSALCTIPSTYDGLTTATVKTTQVLTGTITCIYPGDAVTLDGSTIYVDVPEDQGTNGSNYMVYSGSSESSTIALSPATALFKVRLSSSVADLDYIKITFEGAPVVGRLQISELGNTVISGTQSVQVSENGGDEYLFSVLPGTITRMNVDIVKTNGTFGRKTASSSRTISAGTITNLPIDPATVSFEAPLDYFTITSTGSTSVSLNKYGSPADVALEYRKGLDSWAAYTIGTAVDLSDGETLQFRSDEDGNDTISQDYNNNYYINAAGTGTIVASGNIMSLLDRNLQRESLSGYCFARLFTGCNKLVDATNLILPATTLAEGCYYLMFQKCTGLTSAPVLPATTLASDCYYRMFSGCTGLTSAPELPATTLADGCYRNMFSGCTGLTSAPELPATTLASECYYAMFDGCTGLTSAPELPATTLAESCYYAMFSSCTGLTSAPVLPATTLAERCYYAMFSSCTGLTSAPELPATTLAEGCYFFMFSGCTGLTSAPVLPATTLASSCYTSMFSGCTGLTSAPVLPATTLASSCYTSMFWDCTGLTSAPVLPATTLASSCYTSMFWDCTGLTSAPVLPATTLAERCYSYMFRGCTSLATAPELPATTLASECYYAMFYGCTGLTSAPVLPATTLADGCYRNMFSGCSKLNYIKALFTTTPTNSYTENWVSGVASTGTFVKSSAASWRRFGSSGIPSGWTVVTK